MPYFCCGYSVSKEKLKKPDYENTYDLYFRAQLYRRFRSRSSCFYEQGYRDPAQCRKNISHSPHRHLHISNDNKYSYYNRSFTVRILSGRTNQTNPPKGKSGKRYFSSRKIFPFGPAFISVRIYFHSIPVQRPSERRRFRIYHYIYRILFCRRLFLAQISQKAEISRTTAVFTDPADLRNLGVVCRKCCFLLWENCGLGRLPILSR